MTVPTELRPAAVCSVRVRSLSIGSRPIRTMNSLAPVPDSSPGRDGSSLEAAWFLSSTPTSPPATAASSPPLGKSEPPPLRAAPLWVDVEPLRAGDPRLPPPGLFASPCGQFHSDAQVVASADEAPCMRSLSIRSARTVGVVTTEEVALSPTFSHAALHNNDDMRDVTPPPFALDLFEQGSRRANRADPVENLDLPIG